MVTARREADLHAASNQFAPGDIHVALAVDLHRVEIPFGVEGGAGTPGPRDIEGGPGQPEIIRAGNPHAPAGGAVLAAVGDVDTAAVRVDGDPAWRADALPDRNGCTRVTGI